MTRSEFDRKYTSQLNPQQLAAVHAVGGAVLLLAVPGSGKTTVLVTRLGYMLCCCGISPDAILTMTYTKAATREMQKRFVRLFGQDCPQVPEIRTINGVSSKIIDFYARTHGLYSYIERLLRTNVTRLGAVDHTQILLNKTEAQ